MNPLRTDPALRNRAFGLAGLLLLLAVAAELLCNVPGSVATIGSDQRLWVFLGFELAACVVYFAAVWLIRSGPAPRRALLIVLLVFGATRMMAVATPPFLSSDLFRYVWDGRVQMHGINPYLYLPAAPQLEFLRDDQIYTSVNRSEEAPTIYPPMAQVIFAAIGATWSSLTMVKLVMLGFEVVAVACVAWLLRLAGRPAAEVLVYAWNPLPVWEYAGNGHIDAASIGFIALALVAIARNRRGLTGLLLGLAILCKLLPAALFPAFWRRWDWRMLAATLGIVAVMYGAYAVGAGSHILGFLTGYAAEEGIDTGTGFALLRMLRSFGPLPSWAIVAYLAAGACLLLGLAAWYGLGRPLPAAPGARAMAVGRAGAVLATATTVVISPHYPWYVGWLALLACFAPFRSVIYLSAASVLLYEDPYHRITIFPWLVYAPCLVLAGLDMLQSFQMRRATIQPRRTT